MCLNATHLAGAAGMSRGYLHEASQSTRRWMGQHAQSRSTLFWVSNRTTKYKGFKAMATVPQQQGSTRTSCGDGSTGKHDAKDTKPTRGVEKLNTETWT